jgi:Lon protease-like protein
MTNITDQRLNLPSEAPVMFLPNTVMLPHVLLPLYIFEPRYRAMLAHCLEAQRMFCIALLKPGISDAAKLGDFYHTAGLGLVRACVGHEDGTSHLVLQGLCRVNLRRFVQEQPFRIAQLSELPSSTTATATTQELEASLRTICESLIPGDGMEQRKFAEQIEQISDAGILCDVVAHTFLRNPYRQQEVLEQLDTETRLRMALKHLREERQSDPS